MVRDGGGFDAVSLRTSQTGGNWKDPIGEVAETLDTTACSTQAVAFHHTQNGDVSPCLNRTTDGMGVAHVSEGTSHADAEETDAVEALRELRRQVGEEDFAKWGLGVLASLLPPQVLQQRLHGLGIRCPSEPQHGVVDYALSRQKARSGGSVLPLWNAGCDGRSSQGWRPSEQLSDELGAHLSLLPYAPASAQRFMRSLRKAGEGSRILREALSALEETWRPVGDQPSRGDLQVRRLTPDEAESLQGFPRHYTLIPGAADGPRYRAVGNSMAVPVMHWIGRRIDFVDRLLMEAA